MSLLAEPLPEPARAFDGPQPPLTATDEDPKLRVFVNSNIKNWSRGKMAAHVAHAVLTAAGVHPGTPIVVLGAKPRDILKMRTFIRDEGRTELAPGTLTAGTDYRFPQATAAQDAAQELARVIADVTDGDLRLRLTRVLELLPCPER